MIVGVIGQGTMGAGIAQVAAQNGCTVIAVELDDTTRNKAVENLSKNLQKLVDGGKLTAEQAKLIANSIQYSASIQDCKDCDIVIEAIIENLNIKKTVFSELESVVNDNCILATNTSSLSVTSIAGACKKPERVIGIHFFNPAPIMKLVEIVPAIQTDQEVLNESVQIISSWGKIAVVAKDTPGFIVNRIARPFYSEAIKMMEEGFATKEEIDFAMRTVGQFKMGPFELMDMIGHDVNYVVTETVWTSFFYDPRFKPSFTQKRLLEAGWLGKKSGRGFYNYSVTTATENTSYSTEKLTVVFERILCMLINEAADALFCNIASAKDIETAMTKGVNYPKGLLQWANEIGIGECVNRLDSLYNIFHDDRYRCCALLRQMAKQNTKFEV